MTPREVRLAKKERERQACEARRERRGPQTERVVVRMTGKHFAALVAGVSEASHG